jgi:hypothetical protein
MGNVITILIVAVAGPCLLAYLNGRQIRKGKEQDWERQDAVADQAAEAAKLLADAQERTIKRTDEVARKVEESTLVTDAKLDDIQHLGEETHMLVNSNMTAAKQDRVDAMEAQLVSLNELTAMRQAVGQDPSSRAIATTKTLEAKIADAKAEIDERLEAQRKLNDKDAAKGGE